MFISQVLVLLLASAVAAFIACLDTATKTTEPNFALVTKEWLLLWALNWLVAGIVLYAAQQSNQLSLSSAIGLVTAIFGYPLLLHTKLFTLRSNSPEDEKSFGPQFVLEMAEKFLYPGIGRSIDEKAANLLGKGSAIDFGKLGRKAKDYIVNADFLFQNTSERGLSRSKEDIAAWIDKLIEDTQTYPENKDKNTRALFVEVRRIGGLRGIHWVLKKAEKEALYMPSSRPGPSREIP